MCDFALQAAPNVLFGRYKQYGQVRANPTAVELAVLMMATYFTLAGRPCVVRRVQRDDRRVEAARYIWGHVRLDARGGAQGVRGDPAAAARHQDADHRDTPVVAGRAAAAFPRC
jgi:hypothetical protein